MKLNKIHFKKISLHSVHYNFWERKEEKHGRIGDWGMYYKKNHPLHGWFQKRMWWYNMTKELLVGLRILELE